MLPHKRVKQGDAFHSVAARSSRFRKKEMFKAKLRGTATATE